MKACKIFLIILLLVPNILQAEMLKQYKMWISPDVYVTDRTFANEEWDVDLFCSVNSGALEYIWFFDQDYDPNLAEWASIYVDRCMQRLLVIEKDFALGTPLTIHEYGELGTGTGQYRGCNAIDINTRVDLYNGCYNYYNIYVSDELNNRIEKIKLRITYNPIVFDHQHYYTHTDLQEPIAVSIDDNGTWDPDSDDLIWAATRYNKILAFNTSTAQFVTSYGDSGSGIGEFQNITSIACGRSFDLNFANSDTIYVADRGNMRLVALSWNGSSMNWVSTWDHNYAYYITDLEVDAFGHVWAATELGTILKFTSDLQPLSTYGSSGTAYNEFNKPTSICNNGGRLGGGSIIITEHWTEDTGIKYFGIGVDIQDLFVNSEISGDTCISTIIFTLIDWSDVSVEIFDEGNNLVRDLLNGLKPRRSGVQLVSWDGLDDSGELASDSLYKIKVTAFSKYLDVYIPADTAIVETPITLCQGTCDWLVGDADNSGAFDISDAVYLINFIFGGGPAPVPHPTGSGDANANFLVDISDQVYLINYVFGGGPVPGNPDGLPPPETTCQSYE